MEAGKFQIQGTVNIYQDGQLTLTKANSIQDLSMDVIRRCISGFSGADLYSISVLNNDTLLATQNFSETPELLNVTDNNQVKFKANFDAGSFTGTFNKLHLNSYLGTFSVLTGFTNDKLENHSLAIEWIIEIIII